MATPEEGGSGHQTNADIWSTRIQHELLALTTDNADAVSTQEVRGMLPSFCTVKEHTLVMEQGTCIVNFQVQVETKQKAFITATAPTESETTESSASANDNNNIFTIVVSLDASLPKKRKAGTDGEFEIDTSQTSYPFMEPVATLLSGEACFPPGSSIKDGDVIAMDLDWTPSLHLSDAILNIGLKIKESLLQQETFHAATPLSPPASANVPSLLSSAASGIMGGDASALEGVAKAGARSARGFAASIGKAFHQTNAARKNNSKKPLSTSAPKKKSSSSSSAASSVSSSASSSRPAGEVRIGDEIHLLEEPWVSAHGVYSCKAIRRPKFVQNIMDAATERDEQEAFSSPTAMFRSFTQSARSVLEESFLMITETHVIELKASKLNMSTGKVSFAIGIDKMAKLKFRRQESLSLFFKPAPEDPLIYMCPDSGDAVHQIQNVLKRHGVKGKHTNAAAHRAINEALHLVQEIQTKELALKHDPTVERVNEIMDLYRQTAERFEVAGDVRHEEVVTHMRKFLALPLATSILDGSFQKPETDFINRANKKGGVPEGEVLERTAAQLEADDDHDGPHGGSGKEKEKENDKAFEENIDNLLKEANEDVQNLKLDGGGGSPSRGDDTVGTSTSSDEDKSLADVAADLDAMMREADKELAALMES
jgi:hypothetical protein